MILFIDDMKSPQHFGLNFLTPHARTAEQAYLMIRKFGFDELYLDHDLSVDGMTGYQLLKKLHREGFKIKKVFCISWNPGGAENIQKFCELIGVPYERTWGKYSHIESQSG